MFNLIIDKTNNIDNTIPYYPSRDISDYYPIAVPLLEYLDFKIEFDFSANFGDIRPSFEVIPVEIEKTPLNMEVHIDNNLPEEDDLPVIINVETTNDDLPVIINVEATNDKETNNDVINSVICASINKSNAMSTDMFFSIYSPSYEGPCYISHEQIHEMHYEIIKTVKKVLYGYDNMNSRMAPEIIHNIVQDFIKINHLFQGLTIDDLRNKNHIINLIIGEMITLSIFIPEDEAFILQNVTKSLIIETINYINQTTPSFMLDQVYGDEHIQMIVERFLRYK